MDKQISLARLLKEPIESFGYDDIISFIDTQEPEGLYLDYKQSISPKSLKKHFASFSNKYGGLIIIGVSEDHKTGLPIKTNGIKFEAKDVEQLNQIISNTDPLPNCKVVKVENEGLGFVLVRIFEGDEPPYRLLDDPSIYIRTGNITKEFSERFDRATPEEIKNLLNKKKDSELARENNDKFINEVFLAQLERGERERLKKIQNGVETINFKLGEHCVFAETVIQPSFPEKTLIKPQELKDFIIANHIFVGRDSTFPSMRWNYEPIPEGIAVFEWGNHNGAISNFQLFSNGAVRYLYDVLRPRENQTPVVYVFSMCSNIVLTLRFASLFYSKAGYQGPIHGKFKIHNIVGIPLVRIAYNNFWLDNDDDKEGLLNDYELKFTTNTNVLRDPESRKNFEIGIIKDIHWHLGFETKDWDKVYEKFLTEEFK